MENDVPKGKFASPLLASIQLRAGANDVENDVWLIYKLRSSFHNSYDRLSLSHVSCKGYVHLTRVKTFSRGLDRLRENILRILR